MTITLTKKYRLQYSPPAPNPGTTIRNCAWREEQTGKTRFSDLYYNYYESDNFEDVQALVDQLGLVEADYCSRWDTMTAAQKAQAMAGDSSSIGKA